MIRSSLLRVDSLCFLFCTVQSLRIIHMPCLLRRSTPTPPRTRTFLFIFLRSRPRAAAQGARAADSTRTCVLYQPAPVSRMLALIWRCSAGTADTGQTVLPPKGVQPGLSRQKNRQIRTRPVTPDPRTLPANHPSHRPDRRAATPLG
jgi:hypothetical protein